MSDKIEINEKELAAIDRALVKNRPSVKNIDSKKKKRFNSWYCKYNHVECIFKISLWSITRCRNT